MIFLLVGTFWIAAAGAGQDQTAKVAIHFEPQSPTEAFVNATAEYDALWKAAGARMVAAMERISGLPFEEREIKAVIYEGVSFSGSGNTPMQLRASYPAEVKEATLIHELSHRMLGRVKTTKEIDEHRKIFLVLYDIWVDLYGKEFADRNVAVESQRKGLYDYESAWKWALAMSAEDRAATFKTLRFEPGPTGTSRSAVSSTGEPSALHPVRCCVCAFRAACRSIHSTHRIGSGSR